MNNQTARKTLLTTATTTTIGAIIIASTSWSCPTKPTEYEVRKGDTVRSIAYSTGSSIETFMAWNPEIGARYRIFTGQTLRLPDKSCVQKLVHNVPTIPPSIKPGSVPTIPPTASTGACTPPRSVLNGLTPKQQRILRKMPKKKQACLAKLIPVVQKVSKTHKINPSAMLGQSLLETGICKHVKGNGYWGVKGKSPKGKSVKFTTHENFKRGRVKMVDRFRAFDTTEEAAIDYGNVIESKDQFSDATHFTDPANPRPYVMQLQDDKSKYATDPDYTDSVMQVIVSNNVVELLTPEIENY